jgi:hypothetical protein
MDKPEIAKSQLHYGKVVHRITIVSCLLSMIAPVLILLLPGKNLLKPQLIFNAIFEGKKPAEIWEAAGAPLKTGDFWKLFFGSFFTPDKIAILSITLGCSVTLWALFPALFQFIKKKEIFFVFAALFIAALIALAMSGVVNMAG